MKYLFLLLCPTLLLAVQVGDQVTIYESPPATWEHPYHGQTGIVTNLGSNGLSIDYDGDGVRESGGGVTYSSEGDTWDITGTGSGGSDSNTTIIVEVDGTNVTIDITATLDNEVTNVILNAMKNQLNNLDSDDDFQKLNAILTELETLKDNQLKPGDLDDIDDWLESIDDNIQSIIDKNESAKLLQSVDFIKASLADTGYDTDDDLPMLTEIRDTLQGQLDINLPSPVIVDVNLTSNLHTKLQDIRTILYTTREDYIKIIKSSTTDMESTLGDIEEFLDPPDKPYGVNFFTGFDELNASITEEIEGMRGYITDANGTVRLATIADLYQAILEQGDDNKSEVEDGEYSSSDSQAKSDELSGKKKTLVYNEIGARPMVNGATSLGMIDFDTGYLGKQVIPDGYIDILNVNADNRLGLDVPGIDDAQTWIKNVITIAVFIIYAVAAWGVAVKIMAQSLSATESNPVSSYGLANPIMKGLKLAIWGTYVTTFFWVGIVGFIEADFFGNGQDSVTEANALLAVAQSQSDWAAGAFWMLEGFVPIVTILTALAFYITGQLMFFGGWVIANRASRVLS